jgi:AraC-like DNA-binding protein
VSHSHVVPSVFIRRQLGPLLHDQEKATALLNTHSIPLSALTDNDYVESSKLASLASSVWRLLDDESTGGAQKKLKNGFFKMLCHACSDCKTLKSVLYRTCQFFSIFSEEFHFSLDVKGEEAIFVMNHDVLPESNNEYFIFSLSIVLLRWFAWLIAEKIKMERVEFAFEQFALLDDFENVYSCDVLFKQKDNKFIFSNDYLNKSVSVNKEKLSALLVNSPHCFLSHYRPNNSIAEAVRKYLNGRKDFTNVNVIEIAEQLNFSSATLTRKLKAENTSFMEIKDRIRKQTALSLLRTSEISVAEISYLVDFSEASAFTRAFKKWMGMSPAEYRANHKN